MEDSEEVKSNKSPDLEKEEKTKEQDSYTLEVPLEKGVISRIIKALRTLRNYSQTRLGRILGVQKTQISKLEKGESNITIGTMLRVFTALKAKIAFKIKLEEKEELKILNEIIKEENLNNEESQLK